MPAFYKIDKERRLIVSTATGVFNREESLSHRRRLLADPDFDPSYSQLVDFTNVTQFDLSSEDVRQLAHNSVFAPNARRAFIVASDFAFGLGRMYEMLREGAGENGIRVFRELDDALDWVLAKTEAS
jgi:hypothetical protein